MHIHVHIEIHHGERGRVEGVERGKEWRVGEQLAAVKAMTGVLHPWSPHFKYKSVTIENNLG